MAQSTIYVEPLILYAGQTSIATAWANQEAKTYCAYSYCYYYYNLQAIVPPTPGAYLLDGYPYQYSFGQYSCPQSGGGGCNYSPNWADISAAIVCPNNWGSVNYGGTDQLIVCESTIPASAQPNLKYCQSCLGNPIFASTGQKLQAETDYRGVAGLNFTRTYLSNNGYFASVLTQAFIDGSTPAGTIQQQCAGAYWSSQSYSGYYCFPYISDNSHVPVQYQLRTADGRLLQFTGPNSAVTQAADINERVTQLSVNGATEWQVKREDDSTEIYSEAGLLLQRTLRGGQSYTYTYSTSSTPANIAPSPGLLLSQSDPFGHTLSWQYNSAGQMTQMIDPAGGIYQYAYNSNTNLTQVIYPDRSSKTYEYNESANTGGANLPNTLTGITDENNVRYATFQYKQNTPYPFAVNTQHAGGVDSYSFTYDAQAYYHVPISSTVVVDPLGTSKTYNFVSSPKFVGDLRLG
jgi:YD repeat-containing protein